MGTIITVTNQKGGVGKTSTSIALCSGLSNRGYKVLAVDIDPQSNFSFTAGVNLLEGLTIYEAMKKEASSLQAIEQSNQGFDIIKGSLGLAGADMEFTQAGREYVLKEVLEPIKENYDFVVLDTPPALGILTTNALTASDIVIVPMASEIYSLQGLSQLQATINSVKRYCNSNLRIDGLLLTKYDHRAIINRQLKESIEQIAEQLGTRLYKTTIRDAVAVKEAQFMQGNIFIDIPKAKVTQDYNNFIDEFLKGR